MLIEQPSIFQLLLPSTHRCHRSAINRDGAVVDFTYKRLNRDNMKVLLPIAAVLLAIVPAVNAFGMFAGLLTCCLLLLDRNLKASDVNASYFMLVTQ
jgi:hypothetical protein